VGVYIVKREKRIEKWFAPDIRYWFGFLLGVVVLGFEFQNFVARVDGL